MVENIPPPPLAKKLAIYGVLVIKDLVVISNILGLHSNDQSQKILKPIFLIIPLHPPHPLTPNHFNPLKDVWSPDMTEILIDWDFKP